MDQDHQRRLKWHQQQQQFDLQPNKKQPLSRASATLNVCWEKAAPLPPILAPAMTAFNPDPAPKITAVTMAMRTRATKKWSLFSAEAIKPGKTTLAASKFIGGSKMGSHEDFAARRNAEINNLSPLEHEARNHRGPRQLSRILRVYTKSPTNPGGFSATAATTSWEQEARDWARSRADATGLPIYELPPTLNHQNIISRLPDGIYICHQVSETFGPPIYSDFGKLYDDDRIAAIAAKGPPGWEAYV
jgi:hypothetical protein